MHCVLARTTSRKHLHTRTPELSKEPGASIAVTPSKVDGPSSVTMSVIVGDVPIALRRLHVTVQIEIYMPAYTSVGNPRGCAEDSPQTPQVAGSVC